MIEGGDSVRIHRDDDDPSRQLALSIYAETGSIDTASQSSGVPPSTIHSWINREGVVDELEALRLSIRSATAHKWAGLASLQLDAALERLRQGNEVVDKYGVRHYVPVPFKDLIFGASIATDKHALITGMMVQGAKIDHALAGLADKLANAVREGAKLAASAAPSSPPPTPPPELG